MISKMPTTLGELDEFAKAVQNSEREYIVRIIENVRDTWVRTPAHNYQLELTKLVALIKGQTND
jgi:hypothetical protein